MNSLKFHNLPVQTADDLEFTPATFDAIEREVGNEDYMTALGQYIGSTLFHNASPEQDIDTTVAISVDLVTADVPEREDMSTILKGVIGGFREEEAALAAREEEVEEPEEESNDSEDVEGHKEPLDESNAKNSYDLPATVEEVERHIQSSSSDDSNNPRKVDPGIGLGGEW